MSSCTGTKHENGHPLPLMIPQRPFELSLALGQLTLVASQTCNPPGDKMDWMWQEVDIRSTLIVMARFD